MSRPLAVVALGGNAVSPPRGPLSIAAERARVEAAAAELAALAADGARLLVVHGNGPQVGRLLAAPGVGEPDGLDVHVAQTQGELGYLLAEALERACGEPCVALVTRVLVAAADRAFGAPDKPVGPVLRERPPGVAVARTPDGAGWRRVVASPGPVDVVEAAAIASLLGGAHVVAGGGGGIPLAGAGPTRAPRAAVVDKDWTASLLARRLDAARLVFVTDVPHAEDAFGTPAARRIAAMTVAEARERLAAGVFAPGSMAPKVQGALEFVAATGRPALIAGLGGLAAALAGQGGSAVLP